MFVLNVDYFCFAFYLEVVALGTDILWRIKYKIPNTEID